MGATSFTKEREIGGSSVLPELLEAAARELRRTGEVVEQIALESQMSDHGFAEEQTLTMYIRR